MACLLDECDIRKDDITLEIYKELQDVRSFVMDLKVHPKLLCVRMLLT